MREKLRVERDIKILMEQGSGRGEGAMDIQEGKFCVILQKARSNLDESSYMDEHMHLITSTRFLSTCTMKSNAIVPKESVRQVYLFSSFFM